MMILAAALLFCFGVLPLVFQASLLRPLGPLVAGVRQVEQGELDTAVEVASRDEIGALAEHFNRMTASLRDGAAARARLETMERELDIAREIQLQALPAADFAGHGFALHATTRPAREVGGDFYDHFLLGDGRLAFALGDVAGKGVGAALFAAVTRTLLRATALRGLPPDEVLRHANTVLGPQTPPRLFVTLVCGVLDPSTGEVVYALAGHPPPLRLSPAGDVAPLDRLRSLGLCLTSHFDYTAARLTLAPGEALLLFSDGVTEAADARGEQFEDARLVAALRAQAGRPPAEVVRGVLDAVATFADAASQADDVTLLALRREPA